MKSTPTIIAPATLSAIANTAGDSHTACEIVALTIEAQHPGIFWRLPSDQLRTRCMAFLQSFSHEGVQS